MDREAGDVAALLRLVLLRALWREVVDETHDADGAPVWVEQWLQLEETGFPFINVQALRRLRDAGANLDDVTDVVRSAQVALIYNVACMLDDGESSAKDILGERTPDAAWQLVAGTDPKNVIRGLHDSLEELDPMGRHGEPRAIEERRLCSMSQDARQQIVVAVSADQLARAALLWRRETGDDRAHCLSAVQRLAEIVRRRGVP